MKTSQLSGLKKIGSAAGVALAAALGVATSAHAARVYQFSGKVTGLTADSISLKNGNEVLEFKKEEVGAGSGDLKDIQVGDPVTLWYRLDALKAKLMKTPSQQPGQAAPRAPDLKSGEKKGIIQDDRAFYDARNDRNAGAPAHPHG